MAASPSSGSKKKMKMADVVSAIAVAQRAAKKVQRLSESPRSMKRVRRCSAGSDSSGLSQTLDIKLNRDTKQFECVGLTHLPVSTVQDVLGAINQASKKRAVSATNMNERSSRSHLVFTLTMRGVHRETGETREGVLNLVDLAGSERLSRSGSAECPKLLKEAQCINKSLSTLGNVIGALHRQSTHVPYRDSKLTHLLQNSLGGDSKTLMFCNLSAESASMNESLCSLRFAKKVNSCEMTLSK